MKKQLIFAALLIAALLLSLASGLAIAQPSGNAQGYAPDRILVKFQPGTPEAVKASVHGRHGGKVAEVIPGIDVQVVTVPANQVTAKVRAYRGEGRVLFAEPDYVAKAIPPIPPVSPYNTPLIPSDPLFEYQWALNNTGQTILGTQGTPDADIDAPEAWGVTQGASTVKIAILDTGIDQDHEDLVGKIAILPDNTLANKNFTSSPTWDDYYGHGTHVAGIAAAVTDNGIGVAGVGFTSSLMNGKVLGDDGSGYYSWVASGIRWAADNGAKVINMSLGGTAPSITLKNAVDYAWGKGCVIVAAAGNYNSSRALYPAYYTNCIAVAATDQNDAKASWSNYGRWVDIAAPGVNILSTFPNHSNYWGDIYDYAYWGGTSMATPHVAGVAALVWVTGYGTTASNVRNRIQGTADTAGTMWSKYRIKRVNAYNAVK